MLLLRKRSGVSSDGSVSAVTRQKPWFSIVILVGFMISSCQAYFVDTRVQNRQGPSLIVSSKHEEQQQNGRLYPRSLPERLIPRHYSMALSSSSMEELETEITRLCEADRFDDALSSLEQLPPETGDLKSSYVQILKALVDRQKKVQQARTLDPKKTADTNKGTKYNNHADEYGVHLDQADKLVQKLLELGKNPDCESLLPGANDFNDLITMWGSSTFAEQASILCQSYLNTLWSLYDQKQDERFVPLFESYYYAISACSAGDRGMDAAKRAEGLMKEMESKCKDHPHLTPNRSIADKVMLAWSKSGQKFKKGKKCEQVLEGMIKKGNDMAPNTNSFNIVLNALAQGREKNSEIRAETLLERMESLSGSNASLNCPPDDISFNTVINCWAMSRHKGAAERATAILDHMTKRHDAGLTKVHPEDSTYTTVLKAWARSRDPDAINRAEEVFAEYQDACESGKPGFSHNAFTYNSMINCYAKSRHPDAGKRALELFETMKANMGRPGWEMCFLDIYTYTSVIDAISKQQSYEASERAISLLEEVEESFAKTGDVRLQPNIRLYTSVVNAIGRSHKSPDRAKAIVDRVESSYLEGLLHKEVKPDVVFYNALINAYGWSDIEGRSRKSFEILKHMISLFESGRLADAKPDTVSFNSVLNACAHEQTKDQSESNDIMKTVVEAFELLNSSQEYGRPDQRTYVQVLDSIASHMDKNDEKRSPMAEATFLQCASNGLVGPVVIPKLYATIPRSRFQALMGSASKGDGPQLRFDISELPSQWTAKAQTRYSHNGRRSRSRRIQSSFQVTKNVLTSSKQQQQQQRNGNNRKKNLTL